MKDSSKVVASAEINQLENKTPNVVRVAGVQMDVKIGDLATNLKQICDSIQYAAERSADLVVFPECAVCGYCFETRDEADAVAQPIPGPITDSVADVCARFQVQVVLGMLERGHSELFNTAVCLGPSGVLGKYRKLHLPYLGVDRFTTHGDLSLEVFSAGQVRLGMNICYDGSFPEVSRVLMLQGADLVALPTNWPTGAQCVAECTIRSRALENGLYYVAVNRVGREAGFEFIGQSQVVDPSGRLLHLASSTREEVFLVDCDLNRAREKHVVRVPGQHEIHRVADRRPQWYTALTDESLGADLQYIRRQHDNDQR